MKNKNHIKADNESFRGIGKLGWTESGKMKSTLSRLEATFEEERKFINKKNKTIVICPACHRKFHSNSGKLPKHKAYFWQYTNDENGYCSGKVSNSPKIVKKIDSAEINGETFHTHDKVMFMPYPHHNLFHAEKNEIIEGTIVFFYLMDDESIQIKFRDYPPVPIRYFNASKNFIKI